MVIAAYKYVPKPTATAFFFLTLSFFYGSTYVHLYCMTYTAAGYTYTYCTFTNCTDTVHTREDTVCISQMDRLQIKIINHSHFFTPSKMNSKFPRYTVTRNIEENQIIHKIFHVVSRFSRFIPCYIDYLQDSVLHMLCFQLFFFTTHTYKDIITRIIV